MRIIAGKYKGHIIQPPKGIPARPTTDRAKESIFNILQVKGLPQNAHVLDLFSGSGNLAFECASREAASITTVDLHAPSVQFIKQNFKNLGFQNHHSIRADVRSFIKNTSNTYDLIFADAPYDMPNQLGLIQQILAKPLLKPEGILIWEHKKQLNLQLPQRIDYREYGQSAFSFYQLIPPGTEPSI